jgi:hypothetical protein
MMGGMTWPIIDRPERLVSYQGPAVLTPRDDTREFNVGVYIYPERHEHYMIDEETAQQVLVARTLAWEVDVEGELPTPPAGECTLRLPDGKQGLAVLSHMHGSSESPLWKGKLQGRGPSPT